MIIKKKKTKGNEDLLKGYGGVLFMKRLVCLGHVDSSCT